MPSDSKPLRHIGRGTARGKIVQFPRKRPFMPGTIESHVSHRSPDSRSREIRSCVAELLAKPQFSTNGRRGQLLQYLVEHTLAGDADKVTEYGIGLDVFQKPMSFDPRIESVVRTEFSRLRQRLKEYYAEEGRSDRLLIDFPPRSYAATFLFRDAVAERSTGTPELVPATRRPALSTAKRVTALVLAGLAPVAVAMFALWREHARANALKEPIHAIVVLPFENYSPNHQDEYIADGITEELTNDLAQWRDLRVVARTSAFAFRGKGQDVRQIGRQLKVDAVLEGSFAREGDRLRITAQLNRTADGYHLWSHSYETETGDLLTVQEQVANSIAEAIHDIQGGSPPVIHVDTRNPEAHDLYLQGVYQSYLDTPDSTKKAVDLFQAAIAKDPSFARAYLAMGDAELNQIALTTVTAADGMPGVREAIQKAVQLDPNSGGAWGEMAVISYSWDWNWDQAEEQFRRALDLGAGAGTRESYGWSLTTRGRFAEAHAQLHQAAEQDPMSIAAPFDEFFAYNFERDVAGEKQVLEQMRRLQPNFPGLHALAVVMAVQQHDCATAQSEADWMGKRYAALPATQSVLAYAAACAGNTSGALARMKQMVTLKAPAYQIAIAYALLQDKDAALAELAKAADAHEGQILYLKYDPFFDGIRADPRYVALEKRVGLI